MSAIGQRYSYTIWKFI